MAFYRPEYTYEEENAIVHFIVKKDAYNMVKGDKLWKDMEEENICPNRTWQSLKQHFRKFMINDLHNPKYKLSLEHKRNFTENYYGNNKGNTLRTTNQLAARNQNEVDFYATSSSSSDTE